MSDENIVIIGGYPDNARHTFSGICKRCNGTGTIYEYEKIKFSCNMCGGFGSGSKKEQEKVDALWFSNLHGTIGIVRKENQYGVKFYIGTVTGIDEDSDTKQVLKWGSTFPADAGETLFTGNRVKI